MKRRGVARRREQARAVHRERDRARAVVGVVGEAELVAAAEAVGHPDDLVGGPDGLLDLVGRLVGRVGDAVDDLGHRRRAPSAGRRRRRRRRRWRRAAPARVRDGGAERAPGVCAAAGAAATARKATAARARRTGPCPARVNLFRRPAGLADGLALKEPAPPTALTVRFAPTSGSPVPRTPHQGFGVDARQPTRRARRYARLPARVRRRPGTRAARRPPLVPLGA